MLSKYKIDARFIRILFNIVISVSRHIVPYYIMMIIYPSISELRSFFHQAHGAFRDQFGRHGETSAPGRVERVEQPHWGGGFHKWRYPRRVVYSGKYHENGPWMIFGYMSGNHQFTRKSRSAMKCHEKDGEYMRIWRNSWNMNSSCLSEQCTNGHRCTMIMTKEVDGT